MEGSEDVGGSEQGKGLKAGISKFRGRVSEGRPGLVAATSREQFANIPQANTHLRASTAPGGKRTMQVQPSHAYGDVQRPLSRARRSSLGAPRNLMTFSPLCSGEGSDSLAGSLVKRSVDPSSARLSCARLQILVNQSRKMPSVADRILAHGWSPNAQARPRMVVHCPFAPAGGSFDDSYDSTEDVGRLADGDKDLGSRAGRGIDPHMINPALKKIGDEMRRSHRQLVVHQPHTKSSRANFKFERKIEGRAGKDGQHKGKRDDDADVGISRSQSLAEPDASLSSALARLGLNPNVDHSTAFDVMRKSRIKFQQEVMGSAAHGHSEGREDDPSGSDTKPGLSSSQSKLQRMNSRPRPGASLPRANSKSARNPPAESLPTNLPKHSLKRVKSYQIAYTSHYEKIAEEAQKRLSDILGEENAIEVIANQGKFSRSWRERKAHDLHLMAKAAHVFRTLDIDNNGILSKRELAQGLLDSAILGKGELGVNQLFEIMGSDSGEIHFEDFSAFMHVYFEVNMEKSKTNKSALKKLASQNQKHGTRTRPMYKGKPLDIQDLMLLKRTFNSRHAHGGELLTESSFGRRLLEIAPHFQGHVKDLYMKVLNHVDGTINFPKLIRELFCPGAAPHEMVHLMSTIWPSFKQRIDDGRKYVLATAFDLFCPTFDPIYGSEMDQRQLGRMLQALGYNVPTAKMLVEAGMNHARSPEPGVRVLCFAAFFPWYRQELAFIKMQRAHRATVGLDSNKIYKPSPSDVISAFMSETRKKHAQDDDS